VQERLLRTNHRGEELTLAQGPAVVLGSATAIALASGLPWHVRGAGLLATGGAGALGAYDDLFGAADTKGLRGHLGALAQGEVTSGAVKVVGIGATGLVAGAWARHGRGGLVDSCLAGIVVAGAANVLNLFDLRPGRAAKVFLAVAGSSMYGSDGVGDLLAGPVGAALCLLPEDLAERCMLGDTGANYLGAALGTAAAATMSRPALLGTGVVLVGLTMLSERVSFSEVIEQNAVLCWLDDLGRSEPS
jgi:UDP-N-acetylmuramyl pentapeptide phosphotransferase/UDP-N-acetylglucosamine-1-phosphate transferase